MSQPIDAAEFSLTLTINEVETDSSTMVIRIVLATMTSRFRKSLAIVLKERSETCECFRDERKEALYHYLCHYLQGLRARDTIVDLLTARP